MAEGNPKADRAIAGQNTKITRTIHDMVYNPIRDEIVVTQFYAQAIMTFRGGATGDEPPIRVIHGPDTQIFNPMRLALDPVHREVFVFREDRVMVFPSEAEGNIAPIRVLKGPDTLLGVRAVAVDPVHDLLIASGFRPRAEGERAGAGEYNLVGGGQILIFNRTDSGNTKPRSIIYGPKSRVGVWGVVKVYPPRELLLQAVTGGERSSPHNFVGVWSEHDNGDVPPLWTIGGPNAMLRDVRGIALDPKNKTVIISDKYVNAVMTYYTPEIF